MRGQLTGFGPFRLIRVLGQGERAIVYAAEREADAGVSEPLALKVLRAETLADEAEAFAFEARGDAARGLDGPTIVGIRELGRVGDTPYQVLQRIDGVSLDDLFPKRGRPRFSVDAAITLIDGVLRALEAAAAHTPPLVHGRLEPGNVLIDTDGDVKLGSFGVEGDPQTDLLDLARLLQQLGVDGAPDLDEWADTVQAGDDRCQSVADARAIFPRDATADGQKALARAVKRVQRKLAREAAADAEAASGTQPAPAPASPRIPRASTAPPSSQAPATAGGARVAARSAIAQDPVIGAALNQARVVWIACALVIFAAFLSEIW